MSMDTDPNFIVRLKIVNGFCTLNVNGRIVSYFKDTDLTYCLRIEDIIKPALIKTYPVFSAVLDEYYRQLRFARYMENHLAGGLLCLSKALEIVLKVNTEVIGESRYTQALLDNGQAERDMVEAWEISKQKDIEWKEKKKQWDQNYVNAGGDLDAYSKPIPKLSLMSWDTFKNKLFK